MFVQEKRHRTLLSLGLAGVIAMLAPTAGQALSMKGYPAATEVREITVDTTQAQGDYRSLQGVNGTPSPQSWIRHAIQYIGEGSSGFRTEDKMRPPGVDVSQGFRAMGVDMVRIHDFIGAGDIDSRYDGRHPMMLSNGKIFPSTPAEVEALRVDVMFPNMDADPNDPKSYHFGPTDRIIKSIIDIGAEVYFRIGRGGPGTDGTPPPDFDKYANIVAHIVRHYNQGWANGFKYNIRYWEVWNEPEINDGVAPAFWTGTAEQYFSLYTKIAKAIKRVDPGLLVGGPTMAATPIPSAYREGFMDYVKKNKVPLDFFSWHLYGGAFPIDPLIFNEVALKLRALLDSKGLQSTKSMLSEWNFGYGPPLDEVERATFVATAVLYMQKAPIDKAMIYRADAYVKKDGATLDKVGQALALTGKLRATPKLLATTGDDDKGLAAVAGKSEDGKSIQVMISNYEITQKCDPDALRRFVGEIASQSWLKCRDVSYQKNQGYHLKFVGLPDDKVWIMEHFRLGYGLDTELIETREVSGPIIISAMLPPPGIDFIVLRQK